MENALFVRITHPFSDVQRVIKAWETKCSKLVCYEHIGEDTKKVHCHLALTSCIGIKQLRRLAEDVGVPMSGNENSSSKTWDIENAPTIPLTYMSKGELDPKYIKGYTIADAEHWKSLWVAHTHKRNVWEELWDCFEVSPEFLKVPNQWLTAEEFLACTGDPNEIMASRKASHKIEVKLRVNRYLARLHNNVWSPMYRHRMMCLQNTYEMKFGFSLA